MNAHEQQRRLRLAQAYTQGWDTGARGWPCDLGRYTAVSPAWLSAYEAGHVAGTLARTKSHDDAATYADEAESPP